MTTYLAETGDNRPWCVDPRPTEPTLGDKVKRRGVFEGKRRTNVGTIVKIFPRKANSCKFCRWVARVSWDDATVSVPRIEWLLRRRYGWLLISKGDLRWKSA